MRRHIVGIESEGMHRGGTGVLQKGDLLGEIVGPAGREHHGGPRGQPPRQLHADLAAAAEDHDQLTDRL